MNSVAFPLAGAATFVADKPIVYEKDTFMAGHTTMSPRKIKTPYGDVTLTSKWAHDQYYLCASGSLEALKWLFPKLGKPEWNHSVYRHAFKPAPFKVTVERDLRRFCTEWQDHWRSCYEDHLQGGPAASSEVEATPRIETLGQLTDHLLVVRKHQVKPATLLKEADFLNAWLSALGRGTRLDQLTEENLYEARTKVLRGRMPSTVNSSFAVLRTYLNWAFNKGVMRQAPHKTVRKLKEPKTHHSKPWWPADEVDLALRCAAEDRHQPTAILLIAMGCLLGMRWEEMTMQRWQDLDLDAKSPDGTPAPVCYIVPHDGWQPKDGESRSVPIHSRLHALFLKHRKPTGYVLKEDRKNPRRGGTVGVYRYDPWAVWARVLKRVMEAGGKQISPHGMRHSFASNLLIAGVSDVLVARWLGHADTSMVHERYGHLQAYHKGINQVELSPVKTGEG